jgi:hypothetical protein
MNKFNKGKTLGVAIAALSSLSLAGVGFAAWVITLTVGGTTDNISVKVADVKDERMTIAHAKVGTDNAVNFDATSGGTLLQVSDEGSKEDLTFGIEFTLEVKKDAVSTFSTSGGIKAYVTGSDLVTAVDTNKYITLPTGVYTSDKAMESGTDYAILGSEFKGLSSDKQSTDKDGNVTYTMAKTLTMGWGTAFSSKNPAELTDEGQLDDYITKLNALKALDTKTFTLTLKPFLTA